MDAKLLRNGTIQMKPIVTAVNKNGVTEITYQHATAMQIERLRAEARRRGVELIEEQVAARQAEVSIAGELDFLNAPEMLRLSTKIAYTALALKVGTGFARDDAFSAARNYIVNGQEPATAQLFLHEGFLAACAQGPHQHSVVLVGAHAEHRVDAIVRLFGALCYFITLAENYGGADFYNTLVYNAQKGEENEVLVANLEAEFLQVAEIRNSRETVWNNREAAGRAFLRFIAQAMGAELHE